MRNRASLPTLYILVSPVVAQGPNPGLTGNPELLWPADTQSSSAKMWEQHYEPRFQPLRLRKDPLSSNGGSMVDLPSTTISPVMNYLPLPRIPLSTVASCPPQLLSDPHDLLPSSSHADTVLPVCNDTPDNLLETTLQDLSKYITKDNDYPVARGGFGEIWKCTFHINRTSVKVAVKALQVYVADQLGAAKTKKIKRIKRELRICANLKHPNILPVYGYTYGFGPFMAIVSPWAENGNLSNYLELNGVALTLARRFRLLSDIIAGLQYRTCWLLPEIVIFLAVHANSVIHGDFTGPNVLILDDGTACVTDFGLSLMQCMMDGSSARPSEQSDIFSFGGIMLQVLTNNTPYYYLRNDAAIIWAMQKSEKPSRSRYPALPEKYWEFIEQCWSTDPRDRPSTERADEEIRKEFYALSRSH
ncbi:kinase-like domain-containing protein [Suillus americanus]|nr:kinase-like domain-containing protein [Suillus americanus]